MGKNRFVWDTSLNNFFCHASEEFCAQYDVDVDLWFDVSVKLSDLRCRKSAFEDKMANLCDAARGESKSAFTMKLACSSVYRAFRNADKCVDRMFQDVKKCQKVCAWNHGEAPAAKIRNMLVVGFTVGYSIVGVFAFVRILKIGCKTAQHCKLQKEREGWLAPIMSHLWLSEAFVIFRQAYQEFGYSPSQSQQSMELQPVEQNSMGPI